MTPENTKAITAGQQLVRSDRLTVLKICLHLTVLACSGMAVMFWSQSQLLAAGIALGALVAAADLLLLRSGFVSFMAAAITLVVDVYYVIHLLSLMAAPHGVGSYYYYCTMLGAFFFLGISGGLLYTGFCLVAIFALYFNEALASTVAMTEFVVLLISIACTAIVALFYERAVAKRTYALTDALEEVRHLAHVDYLTGIYNRRQFIQKAEQLFARPGPLTIIALDIDDFKQVNDKYGHAAGDKVLRDIAKVLASHLRGKALFGRTGGEEFMVLLDVEEFTGKARAEELRRAVEGLNCRIGDVPLSITVSLGVASRGPGGDSLGTLISRADKALYEVKGQGKNGVSVADCAPIRQIAV